jgi:parallel beta-helix repeat protein
MSRLTVLFLLAVGLLLAVHPMLAATYAVGTCKPSVPSYATISGAVSGVPSGSTVEVCPGTYAEQVTIAQPLTLKGITSGNAGQAIITIPGSGLTVVTGGFGNPIAAQVAVTATTGPVNISDITVDGTGNTVSSGTWLAGIYYESGSSGTVNEVTVRNLSASGLGVGAWAENASATNELVTIENSSFHDIDNTGVVNFSNLTPPTLSATVKGNSIETAGYDVQWYGGGSLTTNVINGGLGVLLHGPGAVSGNTMTNSGYGLLGDNNGVSATSNKISNVTYGIYIVSGTGGTFQSNTITKATVGIEFNCNTATVHGNTINDATTGLDSVPASFSGANSFDNVVTLRTDGCGSDSVRAADLPAAHSGPMPARVAH